MNIIKLIIQVLLLSTMSMSKKNPIIKYHNKKRLEPYKVVTFTVPRSNNQVPPVYVKIPKTVHQFDEDRAQVHSYIQETLKEFRVLILKYIWIQEEQFSTMQNQILTGPARDHWDEACDVGNGPDDLVDPDAPQQDDFEQVVTNFIAKIVGQESPGNVVWEHLHSLVYNDILKKHAHTPSEYLPNLIGTSPRNSCSRRNVAIAPGTRLSSTRQQRQMARTAQLLSHTSINRFSSNFSLHLCCRLILQFKVTPINHSLSSFSGKLYPYLKMHLLHLSKPS